MEALRTFLQGHNYYVPSLQAAASLGQSLKGRVDFGAPVVASATQLLNALSIAAAVDTLALATLPAVQSEAIMGRFGRNLAVVASAAAVTAVTVFGRDYLGQRMRETFTLNGTTTVVGVKAFRYVDRVVAALNAATTISVGTGARLGLPYTVTKVMSEWQDEVTQVLGTLTAGIFTDPQTAITADPRGLYTPTATPNGVRQIKIEAEFTAFENAAGRGGMHGIAHLA